MTRLAISGAAGFLGRHLARVARSRGDSVLPLVRTRAPTSSRDELPLEDFLRGASTEPLDAFIHAAAIRHRHGSSPDAYREANVDLVVRVARALKGRSTRLVFVSSVGVYGWPTGLPVSETSPYAPRTTYSQAKVLAEQELRAVGAEWGLDVTIVRPCIIYGPGDTNGMLDKMVRMIASHRYAIVGSGDNELHHVYIDDAVDGVLLAARHPAASGGDFILAGPETTTLGALSAHVARAVGVALPPVSIPLRAARVAATIVDGLTRAGLAFREREPPVNHEKLDVMTLPISFDIAKARATFGFAPRVGYAEGVPLAVGQRET